MKRRNCSALDEEQNRDYKRKSEPFPVLTGNGKEKWEYKMKCEPCWCWQGTEPSGWNLADSAGNPQGGWLLVEGIHLEIWVANGTRIHTEIQGKFLKFPQSCNHFNSPKNDVKSSLGYFHVTGTLPMSLNCIFKFWGKHERNFHVEISPGIPQGNEAEISTDKVPLHFPWISAGELWGNFRRDNPLEFPHKSAWKSGGGDGSPTGKVEYKIKIEHCLDPVVIMKQNIKWLLWPAWSPNWVLKNSKFSLNDKSTCLVL